MFIKHNNVLPVPVFIFLLLYTNRFPVVYIENIYHIHVRVCLDINLENIIYTKLYVLTVFLQFISRLLEGTDSSYGEPAGLGFIKG